MITGKKLGMGCLLILAILLVPPLVYGLFADSDYPESLGTVTRLLAIIVFVSLVIYLAVDAAIRHNRER